MDSSSASHRCPGCQRPLEPGRALGLCPRCLLARAAFATEAAPAGAPLAMPEPTAVAAAFPQLEILEFIGRGGMGVVYRARQKSLNRLVALKLLAPGRERDPAFAERFAREAQALAALNHPNIVTVHDFGFAASPAVGEAGGYYFLLMEFVDGVNLRLAMQSGRFTPEQALAIVPPVCGALQFAHERGIVHRDIKPENLLLDKDGRIKIADFGIAKMLGAPVSEPTERSAEHRSAGETVASPAEQCPALPAFAAHTAAGTPQYMAPEQRSASGAADHRADIYSLGVVLYELLTGELPGARLEPPSRRVQIDVRLDEIVLRALKANPELRYQTAGEFRTELETMVSTPAGNMPEAGKAGTPSPRQLRSSRCYITTGEHVDSWWRKYIYMYSGQGRLTLDSDQLAFVGTFGDTVIPLGAIRDIRIGEYPRFMKPHGLNFIRVTFEGGGRTRSLCFIPNEGPWEPTWGTNAVVAGWFTAIREATSAAVAQPRTQTPTEKPAGRVFPAIPQLLRTSNGLLHTPEQLATFEGQFCVWRHRGQLLLDDRQLIHSRDGVQTVIPLAAIRDVSLAQYPLTMNPVGVDFLSVAYEEAGQTKRVCLAPMGGWFAWPSAWNERVADWWASIRNAVAQVTGRVPASTPREQISVPAGHAGLKAFLMAAFALPMLVVFLVLSLARGGLGGGGFGQPALFVALMLLGGFIGQRLVWRFFQRPRQARPARSPWSRVVGSLLLFGALALGWGWMASRDAQVHAEAQAMAVRLQVATAQEADFRAQLAEWTRRTANPQDETQRSHDQAGRSRLQRELESATQRRQDLERTLAQGIPNSDHSRPLLAVVPLLFGGLWLLLRTGTVAPPEAKPRRWMQWLGGILLVIGFPTGGFGTWIAFQIAHDDSWNPAPAEAFLTFVVWISSAASLMGGLALLVFARPRPTVAGTRPTGPNRRLGAGLLVLGCLIPLVAVVYVTTTPPAFRATLRFKADDTAAWLIIPEFWRRSFGQDDALILQSYRETRLFELHGDDTTPEGSVRRVNDAFALLRADKLGAGLEVIDHPSLPSRTIRPNRPLALMLGLAGILFLGLPGLWLIRRGGFVLLLILIPIALLGGALWANYLSLQQPAPHPVPSLNP